MKIEVTQQDIDAGEPKNINYCPIASAIKRLAPDMVVLVASYYVTFFEHEDSTQSRTPILPQCAQTFIKEFDAGRDVLPFTFDLAITL